ncbi:MAG: aminoglycoside phosphotransferase, partial [Pedobacter sp.]
MIQLTISGLEPETTTLLAQYQQELTNKGDYTAQVRSVETVFAKYNKKGNKAFDDVKRKLTDMCCGAIRCHYCEDSEADSVEHHAPKNLYPDLCFSWHNLFYACSSCNRPKRSQYAVFDIPSNQLINVPRHPRHFEGEQLTPPPTGQPVLLNPRVDNPLDYLFLDLQGRFEFSVLSQPGTFAYDRARYTRDILKLNRPALYEARKAAYQSFETALENYVSLKNSNVPADRLAKSQYSIQSAHHQTVWQEMKRQQHLISELQL